MMLNQQQQKDRARAEAEHHQSNSSVTQTREKTADEWNAQIAARFKEYNEPDKSIFGPLGRELRQVERHLALKEKYAKEDEEYENRNQGK